MEDKKLYRNKDTGEVLDYSAMRNQWREEYDGDDPTNGLTWREQYEEVEETPTVYTMEEWAKDGEFNAKAGQEISEEIYNKMLNCIPSKPLPQKKARQALRVYNIPVHFGFLMGEPHSCDKEGNQLYLAFGGNDFGRSVNHKEPHYYYLGLSRTASKLNGFYYGFECLGLIFNGDRTGLPDNVAPVATFEGDDDAISHAADFEATLYKYEYKDGELINTTTLYEPKY